MPTRAMTTEMNELQLTCCHASAWRLSVKRYFIIGNLSEALTRLSHALATMFFRCMVSQIGKASQEAA